MDLQRPTARAISRISKSSIFFIPPAFLSWLRCADPPAVHFLCLEIADSGPPRQNLLFFWRSAADFREVCKVSSNKSGEAESAPCLVKATDGDVSVESIFYFHVSAITIARFIFIEN
jgi:hypothetical protein